MTKDSILYKEIYKYSRDQISKIIFSAVAIVLAFGVTILGVHIKGESEIVPWSYNGLKSGGVLTLIFIFTWVCYFRFLRHLENNFKHSIHSMYENKNISKAEYEFSLSAYDSRMKYIPFAVSFVLYATVIAPP